MHDSWHSAARCAPFVALAVACIPAAVAQTYPAQAIRIIVPQSAGSASDSLARVVGQRMSALLGQPVVVDPRPGAGGLVGSELAANAPADGYTLLIASISSHGTVPAMQSKLPFDPVKDFAPVAQLVTIPNVLVVHPSIPVRNTRELIALAKAKPGELNIGSQGTGSSQHLFTELFSIMAGGIKMVHVPYKGSGATLAAIVSGEIAALMPTIALSLPHIRAGKIRALAVTTAKRVDELPDVPTVGDTLPGYEVQSWIGVLTNAKVPPNVIAILNDACVKALAAPEVRKAIVTLGMNPSYMPPELFGKFIEAEIVKWTRVAKTANIRVD